MVINSKYNPDTSQGSLEPRKVPHVGKGSSTLISDALNVLIEQTKEIDKQLRNLTLEEALQEGFLI